MSIHLDNVFPFCYTRHMATVERPLRKDAERNRQRILDAALVERARDVGVLRADVVPQDLPLIQMMIGEIIDRTRDVEPELWRRYLELVLCGLRARPDVTTPLPVDAPDVDQLECVMTQ